MKADNPITGHRNQIHYLEKIFGSGNRSMTLLFAGIPGIGKKMTAEYLFRKQICRETDSPCGKCRSCRQFSNNTYPDYIHLKPDPDGKIRIGDSNSPEEGTVRWLIRRLSETPYSGAFYVLIENADVISEAGQNALLKTIEEPGDGTVIIITASSVNHLLTTIRSRSICVRFNPLPFDSILSILADKNPDAEKPALEFAAFASGGSVEYAQTVLDPQNLNKITRLCADIKSMLISAAPQEYSISSLSKELLPADLTNILINIYQHNLESLIIKKPKNEVFENLYIDEQEIILKLIKILTALKKSETYNINKDNALKAMITGIHTGGTELPFLERMYI